MIQTNLQSGKKLIDLENELVVAEGQEEGWGRDSWHAGMNMYTLLYIKWITNKVLLYSTWNSAQCYMAVWMGEEFEGEWIRVCVCVHIYTYG